MPKVEINAVVATSHPIPAYGGMRIADEVLKRFADRMRAGNVPLGFDHDLRQKMKATVLDAGFRRRDDGEAEVWARLLMDSDQWDEWQTRLADAGSPGGLSITFTDRIDLAEKAGLPMVVRLAANAFYWDDATILEAAEPLRAASKLAIERLYQLSAEPGAFVYLGILVNQAVPLIDGVAAAAIYDSLKRFLRSDRPSIFNFEIRSDDEVVRAHLETSDRKTLRQAIDSFDRLASRQGIVEWNDDGGDWKSVGE